MTGIHIHKCKIKKFLLCFAFSSASGIYISTYLHCLQAIIIRPSVPWNFALLSVVKLMLPHFGHFPDFR